MKQALTLANQEPGRPILTDGAGFADLRRQLAEVSGDPKTNPGAIIIERYPTRTEDEIDKVVQVLSAVMGSRDYAGKHQDDDRELPFFVQHAARTIDSHLRAAAQEPLGCSVVALIFDPKNPPAYAPRAVAELQ